LPETTLLDLKRNGGKIIMRCPSCTSNRFSELKYNEGKLMFESVKSPNLENVENIVFEDMKITEEIGSEAFSGKVQ
jgi:hypothetical protein